MNIDDNSESVRARGLQRENSDLLLKIQNLTSELEETRYYQCFRHD